MPRALCAGILFMESGTKKRRIAVSIALAAMLGFAAYWVVVQFAQHEHALIQEARRHLERREFQQAGILLDNYLHEHPRDVSARMLAAQTARRGEDFSEALGHLRACERQQGPSAAADLELKLLGLQQGDLRDAEEWLDRCARKTDGPERRFILEALIVGSFKSVFQEMQREVESQGREALVDTNVSRRALDLWQQEARTPADQVQGLIWRGMLHSLERDYPKAQSSLRRALELDPQHRQARLYLAELLAPEKPEEAAAHFHTLLQADPTNQRVRLRLAATQRSLGLLKEAAQLLDEMLVASPDDVAAMVERGKIALDSEQLDEAERWLRRAQQRAPQQLDVNVVLARCLQQAGKETEAEAFRKQAQRIEEELKRRRQERRQKAKS